MAGLENLVQKISRQALDEKNKIIEEAKNKAEELLSKANLEIDKECSKLESKLSDERRLTIDRMRSNTELKSRNNILEAKQDVLKRVFTEVIDELKNISDEDYINYIKASNISDDSELVVSKDKFEAVKNALPNLNISTDRFAESGFIEVTKDTENNYTFSSRVKLIKEELEGKLADILFANR